MLVSVFLDVPENWITFQFLNSLWITVRLYEIYPQLCSLTVQGCKLRSWQRFFALDVWLKVPEKWILPARINGTDVTCSVHVQL